jgi:cytochrome c peroxidase
LSAKDHLTIEFARRAIISCVVFLAASLAGAASPTSRSAESTCADLAAKSITRTALSELGAKLFFDKRLSKNSDISCASCHAVELSFADGKAVSTGTGNARGTRNAPSLLNVAHHRVFGWDGRRPSVADQVMRPFTNPQEHGLKSLALVAKTVQHDSAYRKLLMRVRPSKTAEQNEDEIARCALAEYVGGLTAAPTSYEQFRRGNRSALSADAQVGLELFQGRAGCASCHALEGARFTDDKFHSVGVGAEAIQAELPSLALRVAAANESELDVAIASDANVAKLGHFLATKQPSDIGKFRTPSLRHVSKTAPFMHDGSVSTLEDAVNHELYYRNLKDRNPIILTSEEKRLLLAFLESL